MPKFKSIKKLHLVGGKLIRLSIFEKMSFAAEATDFAKTELSESYYRLKSRDNDVYYAVTEDGNITFCSLFDNKVSTRPIVKYSKIKDECRNAVMNEYGVLEVEYGEYPQKKAKDQEKLFEMEKRNLMLQTGKSYTIESWYCNYIIVSEYEFAGKKYVKKEINSLNYTYGDIVWFEVSPIKWLVDEEKNIALCKNIVFPGVRLSHEEEYMNTHFKEDIIPSYTDFINKVSDPKVYKKRFKR